MKIELEHSAKRFVSSNYFEENFINLKVVKIKCVTDPRELTYSFPYQIPISIELWGKGSHDKSIKTNIAHDFFFGFLNKFEYKYAHFQMKEISEPERF